FGGGKTNFGHLAVAPLPPERTAIVWEGEDGEVRTWTYGELRAHADGLAALLAERGIGEGDAVGVYMPMIPETVAALLGIAKLGAVFLPLFSGYGNDAIITRMNDAGAKALVTAQKFLRRGNWIRMASTASAAVLRGPTLEYLVQVPGEGWVGHLGRGSTCPKRAPERYPTRLPD